ncbi:cucumber peeling cupredoxin-like [Gastrolobium bilobum]|uniref:cucumber peeling cupredoxin-like n=1 Tax=Gastrolobium bilobum TaxID=150636 RepID=UPI002AB2599D|nr:cucumber peeling cupredoxin-like [Gastrolobium bilobum]
MNKMSSHAIAALGGVVAILMLLQRVEAQRLHVVGDDMGWIVPQNTSAYQTWASKNNFAVGDILLFNFETNQHDVLEVPRESYNSCSSENSIGTVITTGPTNVTLNKGGEHYYICTIGQHCNRGQKLAINVSGSTIALPPSTAIPPATTATPDLTPPSPSSASCAFATFPFLLLLSFICMAFWM